MTRLEVDIDTEKRGEHTVISTDLRVVREHLHLTTTLTRKP